MCGPSVWVFGGFLDPQNDGFVIIWKLNRQSFGTVGSPKSKHMILELSNEEVLRVSIVFLHTRFFKQFSGSPEVETVLKQGCAGVTRVPRGSGTIEYEEFLKMMTHSSETFPPSP